MTENGESRGKLGDMNQKPKPVRQLTEDDIVENPEEFDGLRYFELSKDLEEKNIEEANIIDKKIKDKAEKVEYKMTDNDVTFTIYAAFKHRLPYKDNIPPEWIIDGEQYKDDHGYYVPDAGFYIHADFKFSWTDDDLMAQLGTSKLRSGLYLLQKVSEWETDDNCIEARISNEID